jgi:hypothetical protein
MACRWGKHGTCSSCSTSRSENFAKAYFHIDSAIKSAIRGHSVDADAQSQKGNLPGDEGLFDDDGDSAGDRWETLPTTNLPDAIANGVDQVLDNQNRPARQAPALLGSVLGRSNPSAPEIW